MRLMLSIVIAALTGWTCLAGSGSNTPPTDLSARIHFVGAANISADTNATGFNKILAGPEAVALREELLSKFSTTPYRLLKNRMADGAGTNADLLRPLMEDLFQSEWYAESQGTGTLPPEFVLALRVDEKHAATWQSNLATVITAWTGIATKKMQVEGYDGWELQKHDVPNRIRFVRVGEWAVFGWGQDEPHLQSALLKRIKSSRRPVDSAKDYWLDATVDFAGEAAARAALGSFKPSQLHLVIQGRKDFVRPQITLRFADPLDMKLESWRIPTNIVHGPLISFTAVRGVSGFLKELPFVKKLGSPAVPNQFLIWAIEQVMPFETGVVAPMPDASNYLEQLQPALVSLLNTNFVERDMRMRAEWTTNHEVFVKGLPLASPWLRATNDIMIDYLMAGMFPSPPRAAPLPPDLANTLATSTNLALYDWEITEVRLKHWKAFSQLDYIARFSQLPDTNTPAQIWLEAVRPKLGNSATRITLSAPNELTLVRNSVGIGLTSIELNRLANWIDATNFPIDNHHEARQIYKIPENDPDKDKDKEK